MSGDPHLDLDDILAEFHSQETAPQQPEPAPRRRAAPRFPETQTAAENAGTVSRPARHAAPEPAPQPPRPEQPAPAPSPAPRPALRVEIPPRPTEQPQPEPVPVKPAPRKPRAGEAQKLPREARPTPRRKGGKGGMLLVLLMLTALLAGILWWTARTGRENASPEPEPDRMELGEALEEYLFESSGSSRN